MADTRQGVSWALERKCDFRTGDSWYFPGQTILQLADFRRVAEALQDKRVVDGICVTAWTDRRDKAGRHYQVPYSGFRVDERLAKHGGWTAVVNTCGSCEANAQSKAEIAVAGCHGTLDVWPDSQELEEQLWKIVEHHGLENRLRTAFPVTTPLWYGLWIESPLKRSQIEVLYDLLNAACDFEDPKQKDAVHFLNALSAAISEELPVHVSLAPPGHVDLGWHTVFPHCPRCKASAPVARWHDRYTTEPHQCRACGHTYIPNEHHSSAPCDWETTSLKKDLEEYQAFAKRFLVHRGCTEQQAKEVIDTR
jgi:hypothetical protein